MAANSTGVTVPEIEYRKAQTIKASDDWIERKLKQQGNSEIYELAKKHEFCTQDFQLDKAERKHYAVMSET